MGAALESERAIVTGASKGTGKASARELARGGVDAAIAARWPPELEDAVRQDFTRDSPRGHAISRMVDAAEIASLAAFPASGKAWAVTGAGGAGRASYD